MFTGLIEELATVAAVVAGNTQSTLEVRAPKTSAEVQHGDSISVNGCCLTVVQRERECLRFDLLQETLDRTNLTELKPGSAVNLERALAANARLGGHFVQGHIDCTAPITALEERGADLRLEIEIPRRYTDLVVEKGSIAINGVSLTVAELSNARLAAWIIPETRRATNLGTAAVGNRVNIEFDILAKYVERMLNVRTTAG